MPHDVKIQLTLFLSAAGLGFLLLTLLYPRFGYETFTWAGSDAVEYNLLAENFVEGHGFSLRISEPYIPSAARMPGYPLLLAFSRWISGGILLIIISQILANSLSVLITYRLARRFLPQGFSTAAAILLASHIYFVFLGISLITDSFFILSLLASLYAILRYYESGGNSPKSLFLAALFLGFSALLRPTSLLVVILWAGVVFFSDSQRGYFLDRKRYLQVGGLALIFVLMLLPWATRNKLELGRFSLVSANPYGFYVATSVQLVALKEKISRREAREKLLGEFSKTFAEDLARDTNYPPFVQKAYDKFEYADWFSKKNDEIIKSNFPVFLRAVLIAVPEFLTKNEWLHPFEKYGILRPAVQPLMPFYRYWSEEGIGGAWQELIKRFSCGISCILSFGLVVLGRIFYLLVVLLGAVGTYSMLRNQATRFGGLVLLVVVLYFAAVHLILTGAAGHERYRLPIVPIMIIQALFGFRLLTTRFRKVISAPFS